MEARRAGWTGMEARQARAEVLPVRFFRSRSQSRYGHDPGRDQDREFSCIDRHPTTGTASWPMLRTDATTTPTSLLAAGAASN